MKIFEERLKCKREENGLSKKQMADLLGISRSAYARYENGGQPRFEVVCRIAKVLNIRLNYLFGLED